MNIVTCDLMAKPRKLLLGDVFESDDALYILSSPDAEHYQAFNLSTGRSWAPSTPVIEEAVDGLQYVGRNLKITISQ